MIFRSCKRLSLVWLEDTSGARKDHVTYVFHFSEKSFIKKTAEINHSRTFFSR